MTMTDFIDLGKKLCQFVLMRLNLALWDRVIRIFFGFMLTTWAIAGGPWWCYFGLYLLFTGAWGICAIYGLFKIRTKHDKRKHQGFGETAS